MSAILNNETWCLISKSYTFTVFGRLDLVCKCLFSKTNGTKRIMFTDLKVNHFHLQDWCHDPQAFFRIILYIVMFNVILNDANMLSLAWKLLPP